jgi:competence protein ComFC
MSNCPLCKNLLVKNWSFLTLFDFKPLVLCETCKSQLVLVRRGCPNCGKAHINEFCSECLHWRESGYLVRNYSLYIYNEFAKDLIKQIKFKGDCSFIPTFKPMIRQYLKKQIDLKEYEIVIVPLHENRLKQRGFNQSLHLAKLLGRPFTDCFMKSSEYKQSKKTRSERLATKDDFMFQASFNKDLIKGKQYLIVDDIYTTGSTIHQLANLLIQAGAKEVISFTLFRS